MNLDIHNITAVHIGQYDSDQGYGVVKIAITDAKGIISEVSLYTQGKASEIPVVNLKNIDGISDIYNAAYNAQRTKPFAG